MYQKLYNMRMRKIIITLLFVLCCLSVFVFLSSSSSILLTPITKQITQNSPVSTRSSRGGPSPQTITLVAVGDVMLGRSVNAKMRQLNDFTYPFQKTADILKSADLTFGNLESPFWSDCPTTNTGMIFCADPKAVEGLTFAGFDILSISNNHILNYGQGGLDYTKQILSQNGIEYSDSVNLSMKQWNNETIGILSFNLVTYPKTQPVLEKIKQEVDKVDILVVSLHWGTEYQKKPQVWQVELAHQIIDNGAKVVIGHHPHVTQSTEEYNNGLIFYSLGNFVFDQPWSEETKKGNIAKIIFEGKEIKSWQEIPIYINNLVQPIISN